MMRVSSGGDMKQEKRGSDRRPNDNRAIAIMLAILIVLAGLIVWILATKDQDSKQQQGAILLDSVQGHATADLTAFYSGINNGDSWLEITETIGWPGDCLKEITTTAGKQQVCSWYSDQASVVIVLLNEMVVTKTKVGF